MTPCPELRRLSAEHARWLARREGEEAADRASRLLALWDGEILPHCRAEEEVLLPELTCRLSEADALVVFTLGDHVVLRRIARALRAAEGPARAEAAADLARKLEEHVAFEERTLFPALQANLGCARLAELGKELARDGGPARRKRAEPASPSRPRYPRGPRRKP